MKNQSQVYARRVQKRVFRWRNHTIALSLLAIVSFSTGALAQATLSDPDCQCRAPDGQMRDLGTVECVDIVGTKKMVSCVMSTNTPYWKTVEGVNGCPDA